MSRTVHLFELIHSLTPTEKGYFKRYSKLHTRQKDLKYMRLFDVVERLESYDDKQVQKLVSDEITAKLFPVVKNYLYNLILKSLESYYSGKNPEIEVRNIMNQVTILYYKGLINHAQKGLRKAKSLTEKHELLHMKADLLELERHLLKDLNLESDADIINEEEENLEKIERLFKCKKFERMLVLKHWVSGIALEDIPKNLNDSYKEIGIFSAEEALTKNAKLHFNHGSLLYYYVKNNLEKAFSYAGENYDLIRAHPEIFDRDEKKYIRVIYIYLGLCLQLNKQPEFWDGYNLLSNLKSGNFRTLTEIFDQKYNLAFNSAISFREFAKGLDYIKEFEKNVSKFEKRLSSRSLIVFYHLIAYLLQLDGDSNKALTYTSKVEEIVGKETRQDIKSVTKIQDITIHFDLNNWQLLKSKIRNTQRFLKQKDLLSQGELALLNGLEKIRKKGEINNKPDFSKLHDTLAEAIKKDPNYLWIQRSFDFMSWLKSKTSKSSFSEVLSAQK